MRTVSRYALRWTLPSLTAIWGRDKAHFYQNDERMEEPLYETTQELERKENSDGLFEDTA